MGNIGQTLMPGTPETENLSKAIAALQDVYGIQPSAATESVPVPGAASPVAAPIAPEAGDPAEIVVKGFKPKKRSILGLIGDAILLHSGHKGPFFADRVRNKNLNRALEGFTQDPLEAIRRVAKIPGMEEEAWKMFGQYQDDRRADEAQERLLGKDMETKRRTAMSILGRVRDDGSNYDVVRAYYNSYVSRNGIDAELLPEEFNPDIVESAFLSGMMPKDVAQDEIRRIREARQARQGDARLEQGERRLDITEKNVDSQIESREVRDEAAIRGVAVRERAEDRLGKKGAAAAGGGRKVKTKYGIGEVSPSGKTMRVKGPDGKMYFYTKTGENTWQLAK